MGKVLKLGFAMGGGVSLGSFSGASLTESIKLALLYGVDSEKNPYDKVEIDVFSGASAGAMSLGVMLKALAFPSKDVDKRKTAWRKLVSDYHIDEAGISNVKKDQLIDAELAQQELNQIWVKEITLDKLLNPDASGSVPPLRKQAGICNKAAVTDIAKAFLSPPEDGYKTTHKATHPLLSKRVLYSCSISNLNPLVARVHNKYLTAPGNEDTQRDQDHDASNDALTSKFHQEHRIFDINFEKVAAEKLKNNDIHPRRWMRFHWGAAVPGKTFDIRSHENWKHILATAIASGAFPVAFEPVPLLRYQWEYPEGLWHFKEKTNYTYTYVDGGMFANSPVTEAFKLASHIDATAHIDQAPDSQSERRIIFVDPSVGSAPSYNLAGFKDVKDQKPLEMLGALVSSSDGNDLLTLSSLDKLLPTGLSIFTAIHSQASAQQGHRNYQIANKLKMRNGLRKILSKRVSASKADFEALREALQNLLSQFSDKALIPTLAASLENELERLAREPDSLLTDLKGQGKLVAKGSWDEIKAKSLQNQGMQAMVFSYLDLIADLEAKSRNSQLVSIGPIEIRNTGGVKKTTKIFLPGEPLAGFAGFMSELPSAYEVKVAQYCTFTTLSESKLIASPPTLPISASHPGEFAQQAQFATEFEAGMLKLSSRLENAIADSRTFINKGWFNSGILWAIKRLISKKIKEVKYNECSKEYEFRIRVNSKKFELDGSGWADNDRHPIRDPRNADELILVCFATRDWNIPESEPATRRWSGYFIENGELGIDTDSWASLRDNDFIQIPMPSDDLLKQSEQVPNPIFYSKSLLKREQKPSEAELRDFWELRNDIIPYTDLL